MSYPREAWVKRALCMASGFILLVALWMPGAAMGQAVTNFQNAWTNTGNPLAGGQYTTQTLMDNAISNAAILGTGTNNNLALIAALRGRANDDGDANVDSFNLVIRSTQQFQTNAMSTVSIPTHLNGVLGFPGGNAGVSSVTWNVTVLNALNVPTGLAINQTVNATQAGTGNVNINNNFQFASMNLAAGTYTVQATLTLTGTADATPGDGVSQVDSNFFTNPPDGLSTSFSAIPLGLGDSRAFVRAAAGRAQFQLTGQNVNVGIVEPGHSYTTHTSMLGRINALIGPAGVPGGVSSADSEHTLATAGIVGSASGNTGQAGVAPGATLNSAAWATYNGATASAQFRNATTALIANGATVINMSASTDINNPGGDAPGDAAWIDGQINANPNLVFVKSAGNAEPLGGNSVTSPGQAFNILTVGALNRTFTQRAAFSSFSHGNMPIKPDLVAPGEFIVSPLSRDTNADVLTNDFGRGFLGDDYHRLGPTTNDVTGTSFAAPFVTGAIALMQEFQANNAATHDADHRVLKAVMLNMTNRHVEHNGGGAWSQASTGSAAGQDLVITRSLDPELGAGALDVVETLALYSHSEALASDNNVAANFNITPVFENRWWDLESVAANGTVNYLLSDSIDDTNLRAVLTWDHNGALLPALELRLFHEGSDDFNLPGYDPGNPNDDVLIAQTLHVGDNVKLFDFFLPDYGASENPGYYLQVINSSGVATTYGIAFYIPEPTTLVLLCLSLVFVSARSGAKHRRGVMT